MGFAQSKLSQDGNDNSLPSTTAASILQKSNEMLTCPVVRRKSKKSSQDNTSQYAVSTPSTSTQYTKIALAVDPSYVDSSFQRNSIRGSKRSPRIRETFDPRVLARYDIKALIGKGSFSKVVRAQHRVTGQTFAIKLLNAKKGTGPFETELSILSRVRHPNIIQLIEVFRTKSRVYMVMELATGGELYDRIIAQGAFPEIQAARHLRMVLDGLGFLHNLGITHRDVKPENLLYSSPSGDAVLLISDFGLAHVRGDEEDNTMATTCGTPEYIAPEVLLRQRYTNKVDIWAVGVIAFILLSGSMPFDDENRTRLYISIIRARYKFFREQWIHTTRQARDFVRSLLEPDQDLRLSSREALSHPWLQGTLTRNIQVARRTGTPASAAGRQRTHSSRSTRSTVSIARSEPHRRVRPEEVDRLVRKPEIQRLLVSRQPGDRILDVI